MSATANGAKSKVLTACRVLIAAFYAIDKIEPFHQRFALQNYTLQYPFAEHEKVPMSLAFVLVIVLPAGIIAFYTMIIDGLFSHSKAPGSKRGPYTLRKRLWELNCGILGLLLASGTAFVITQAMKNATGKPRPDFIDRCQPKEGSVDPKPAGLSTDEICTRSDLLRDGFRSFPSGHSSSSFAGLFYLSLYLAGKLHIFDSRGFAWKTFIIIVPTLGASLIAISRIEDARHHPFDVISGSLLGILCAWGSYRQYFPPLSEPWKKGRAYPIRTWGSPEGAEYVGDGGYRAREGGDGFGKGRTSGSEAYEAPRNGPVPPQRVHTMNTVSLDEEAGDAGDSGGNVFRQQVERTQRDREDDRHHYGISRGARDEWEESSSDDDSADLRRARGQESFELQPRGAGPTAQVGRNVA
jgi:diacylglycerol diphosphate phosphatase/phosphatidate phosphatase